MDIVGIILGMVICCCFDMVCVFSGTDGTINKNEQIVFDLIRKEEGLNAIEISERISKSLRMTKRYLKSLNKKERIEFRGTSKTGGYYLK